MMMEEMVKDTNATTKAPLGWESKKAMKAIIVIIIRTLVRMTATDRHNVLHQL